VHLISRGAAEHAEKGKKLCFLAKNAKGAKTGKKIQVFGFPRSQRLCEKQRVFGFLSELGELGERQPVLIFREPRASA